MLDRYERLEAVISNIQADQQMEEEAKTQHLADVEQAYISQAEKQTLTRHKSIVNRLQQAEFEMDQFMFVLQSYLNYIPPPALPNKRAAKPLIID